MASNLQDSNATYDNDVTLVDDVVNIAILSGTINVGTSQVEAKIGASKLASRKCLVITNLGNATIYWGATGIATTTGTPLYKNSQIVISAGESMAIFLISGTATNDVRIVEFS